MLSSSQYLVLAFQLWALSPRCMRAQIDELEVSMLQPPYELIVTPGHSATINNITFSCTTTEGFTLGDWALYRNSIPENTTDPCIAPWQDAFGYYRITSACDGLYSCGANYNTTGLVLSEPIAVYGEG